MAEVLTRELEQQAVATRERLLAAVRDCEVLAKLQRRYERRIKVVRPDAAAPDALVEDQGVNGIYQSLEAHMACSRIRKVGPFERAIAGYGASVTGVRREGKLPYNPLHDRQFPSIGCS